MTVLLPERGNHLMVWSMAHRKQKTARRGGQEVCVKPLSWVTLQKVLGQTQQPSRLEQVQS